MNTRRVAHVCVCVSKLCKIMAIVYMALSMNMRHLLSFLDACVRR